MDWAHPPTNYASLCLWKVFVKSYDGELWQVVNRWVKKYGNPFVEPDVETDVERDMRLMHQGALLYITDP